MSLSRVILLWVTVLLLLIRFTFRWTNDGSLNLYFYLSYAPNIALLIWLILSVSTMRKSMVPLKNLSYSNRRLTHWLRIFAGMMIPIGALINLYGNSSLGNYFLFAGLVSFAVYSTVIYVHYRQKAETPDDILDIDNED